VPVVDIVRVAGLLTIPLVYLSLLGFMKILGFRFFEWKSQVLFWIAGTGNVISIILFTQIWPAYYILMMIGGAVLSLAGFYAYGRLAKREAAKSSPGAMPVRSTYSGLGLFKAYAPLILGVILVIVTRFPGIGGWLEHFQFDVAAWDTAASRSIFLRRRASTFLSPRWCVIYFGASLRTPRRIL